MRTITKIALAALMTMAVAMPAFANDFNGSSSATTSSSSSIASSVDLACMSAAVDARESATVTARTTFNARIMTALDVRRAALKAAYTIANNDDRRVAIEAAVTAYAKAIADARAKFSADVKAAWSVFAAARVNCHIDQGNVKPTKKQKDKDDENDRNHQDRGLHLGWFKNSVNAKAWLNGHMNLDLSN